MMSAEECRQRAAQCFGMAMSVSSPEREKYLMIARAWLTLADEVVVVRSHEMLGHRGRQAKRAA